LLLPVGFSSTAFATRLQAKSPARNPKWYGFNLLEYFSTDPDWMKYFPYKNDDIFQEDDVRWIRDWGFNWVRLPMDYRFWTDSQDLLKIREDKVAPIDRAIQLGEKYGIHINLGLHRPRGYCVLDTMDEALTGIHVTKEKSSVFTDPKMLNALVYL
jgi:endoglucanase